MSEPADNNEKGPEDDRRSRGGLDLKGASGVGMASTVGITIVVATVIGYLFGQWLDKVFKTEPVFLAIFVLLGAAAGLYEAYRVAERMSKDDPK